MPHQMSAQPRRGRQAVVYRGRESLFGQLTNRRQPEIASSRRDLHDLLTRQLAEHLDPEEPAVEMVPDGPGSVGRR